MNVFIKNIDEICTISKEQGVDMEIATIIFARKEDIRDYNEDKLEFNKLYTKWYNSNQRKTFAEFVKGKK